MKIVLISPKGPLYRFKGGVFKKSLRYQPLTLTTLAAYVPEELEAELELIDEGIQNIPHDLQVDLVAMTVITGTAKRAYQLADDFRLRGIPVVLGGPHVTLMPDEAGQHADSICTGYAEETWPQLLRDFAVGNMQAIYSQRTDLQLGYSPFARRELFDREHFLTQAVFEATRSCAHDCEFCVAPTAWGNKQYQRPIDWVIEDIRRMGEKKIIFVDLNIISDRDYAKELFRQLIPLKLQWFGLSTVLIAHDDELMELLARSGCRGLLLGLETISEDSLNDAHKNFNKSVSYRKVIADLHHLGISIQGCFVFGLDHDTTDVFDNTVEFAIETGIELPRFAILTPFPGTPIYHDMKQQDRILTENWELYDGQHVVFQPNRMSVAQLAAGHENAWKKVYRYSSIVRRLWNAHNFRLLALSANLGYRFYAHHLHEYYNCDVQINPLYSTPFAGVRGYRKNRATEQSSENRIVCG